MEMSGQLQAPADLAPVKSPGPQSRSGYFKKEKILFLPKFETRTVESVA